MICCFAFEHNTACTHQMLKLSCKDIEPAHCVARHDTDKTYYCGSRKYPYLHWGWLFGLYAPPFPVKLHTFPLKFVYRVTPLPWNFWWPSCVGMDIFWTCTLKICQLNKDLPQFDNIELEYTTKQSYWQLNWGILTLSRKVL